MAEETTGGYKVGNLEVAVTSLGNGATASLDQVIARLNTIMPLINSVVKSVNTLQIGINTNVTINKLNKSLKDSSSHVEKIQSKTRDLFDMKKIGQAFSIGKIYAQFRLAVNAGRGLYNVVSSMVEKASDYVETLNLWQVAFKENINGAEQFIQKMNKLYGVSEKNLMNYQAIFKNMFSSLGGLTEATSSKLSEAFTSWALDFSSLFNVSIESAMSKFQAVLSGQVRPVRSVSGFDITERTLFNIYQNMGGTKTMRQLDILEKRLLSVLAIYEQMNNANALGDLGKTINQFANQQRIMKELMSETMQWAGTILKLFIDDSEIMVKINAGLIVMRDLLKGVAKFMGYEQPDFTKQIFETTENANGEIDKLQKKLLSFDKFEVLNSSAGETNIGIDQKILDYIANYESSLGLVDNKAQLLAEQWEKILGFQDDGKGNLVASVEMIEGIIRKVKEVSIAFAGFGVAVGLITSPIKILLTLFGYLYLKNEEFKESVNGLLQSFAPIVTLIIDVIQSSMPIINSLLNIAITFLNIALPLFQSIEPIVSLSLEIVKFFMPVIQFLTSMVELIIRLIDSMGLLQPLILGIGSAFATWKILDLMSGLKKFNIALSKTQLALAAVAVGLGFIIGDGFLSLFGDDAKKIVAPIMLAVGAISALAIAIMAIKGVLTWGVGIPILLAAVGAGVAGLKTMLQPGFYAQGGYPDQGTLFIAGEAGAEVVMSDGSGRTSVTNIAEMEEAVYRGARRALSEARFGGGNGNVYLDGKKVGIVTEGTTYSEGVRVGRMKQEK